MKDKFTEVQGHYFLTSDVYENGDYKLFRRYIKESEKGQPLGMTIAGLGLRNKSIIQRVLDLKVGESYQHYTRTR